MIPPKYDDTAVDGWSSLDRTERPLRYQIGEHIPLTTKNMQSVWMDEIISILITQLLSDRRNCDPKQFV